MTSADHANLFLQKKLNGVQDEFKSQQQQAMLLQNIFNIESIQVEVLRTEISNKINIYGFQPSFSLHLGSQSKFNSTNQYRDPFNAIFNEIFEFDCSNGQQVDKLILKLYHNNQIPQQQQQQQQLQNQLVQFKHSLQNNKKKHAVSQKQLNISTNLANSSQNSNHGNNVSPKTITSRICSVYDEGKKRMNTDNTVQTNYSKGNNPFKEQYMKMLESDNEVEQLLELNTQNKKKSFDDLDQAKKRDLHPLHRQMHHGNLKERGFSHAPEQTSQHQHFVQSHQQQQSQQQMPVSQFHSQKINQANNNNNNNRAFKMFQNNGKSTSQTKLQGQPQTQQQFQQNQMQQQIQQQQYQQQQQQLPQQQTQILQNNNIINQTQLIHQQSSSQTNSKLSIEQNQQIPIMSTSQNQMKTSQKSSDTQQIQQQQPQLQSTKSQIQQALISQQFLQNNDQQLLQQSQQQQLQLLQQQQQQQLQQQEIQRYQKENLELSAKLVLDEQRIQAIQMNINQLKRQLEDEIISTKVKNDCQTEKLLRIEKESYQYSDYLKIVNEEEDVITEQIKVMRESIQQKKKSLMIKKAENKILQRSHDTWIKKLDQLYSRIRHYENQIKCSAAQSHKQENKVDRIKQQINLWKEQNKEQQKVKRRYSIQDPYSDTYNRENEEDPNYPEDPLRNIRHLLDENNVQRQQYLEAIQTYQNFQVEYQHTLIMEQTVKEKYLNLQDKLSELGIQETTLIDRQDIQDQSRGSYSQITDRQSLISAENEQILQQSQNHIYFRQNEDFQDQKDYQHQFRSIQQRQQFSMGQSSFPQRNTSFNEYEQQNQKQILVKQNSNISQQEIAAGYQLLNETTSISKIDNRYQQSNQNPKQSNQRSQNGSQIIIQPYLSQQTIQADQSKQPQSSQLIYMQNSQQQYPQLGHTHSAVIPNHYELSFNANQEKQQKYSQFKNRYQGSVPEQMIEQLNDGKQNQSRQQRQQNVNKDNQPLHPQSQIQQQQQQQYKQQNQGLHYQTKSNQEKLLSINTQHSQLKIEGPSFEQHIQSVTAKNSPRLGYSQPLNFQFQPIKSSGQLLQLQQLQTVGNSGNSSNNSSNNSNLLQNMQSTSQQGEENGSIRNKPGRYDQKSVDLIYTQQSPYSLLNQNEFAQQSQQPQQIDQQSHMLLKPSTPLNKKNKSDINQIQIISNQIQDFNPDAASPEFLAAKNNNSQYNNNASYNNSRMLFTQIVGQAQQQLPQQSSQLVSAQYPQIALNNIANMNNQEFKLQQVNMNNSFDGFAEQQQLQQQPQFIQQNSYQTNQQLSRGSSYSEQPPNQKSKLIQQNNSTQQSQLSQIQQQQHQQQLQQQPQLIQQFQKQQVLDQKQDMKSRREQYIQAKQLNQQQQLMNNNTEKQQNNILSNNLQAYQNINDLNQVYLNTTPTLFGQYFNSSKIVKQDQSKS